jgi:nitroalkane oxidase
MAIDFTLTAQQRELQCASRKFAKEVLSPAIEAEFLPTSEERFAATKPAYEAMIAAGFLRKCIPLSAGALTDRLPVSRRSTRTRGVRERNDRPLA